jgi:hypothetical protein
VGVERVTKNVVKLPHRLKVSLPMANNVSGLQCCVAEFTGA